MHLFNSLCLVFPSHCHLKLGSPWIGMTRICVDTTKPYHSTRTTSRMGLEYHQPALSSLFLSLYKLLIIWTEQLLFPPPLVERARFKLIGDWLCLMDGDSHHDWNKNPVEPNSRMPMNAGWLLEWNVSLSLSIHSYADSWGVPTLPK